MKSHGIPESYHKYFPNQHTTGGTHKDPMSHAIYTPGKAYVASGIQPTSTVTLREPPDVAEHPTQKPTWVSFVVPFGPACCLLRSADKGLVTSASTLWLGLEMATVVECI